MTFPEYRQSLSPGESDALQAFFEDFDTRCLLSKLDKNAMREDFERAILRLREDGLSLSYGPREHVCLSSLCLPV